MWDVLVWGLGGIGSWWCGDGRYGTYCHGEGGAGGMGTLVALGLGVMRPTIMRNGDLVAWGMGAWWHRDSFLLELLLWGTRSQCGAMGTWF